MTCDEPACECPGPGFCGRYGIRQGEYHWQLCRGVHGAAKGCGYRKKWRERRDGGRPAGVATPPPAVVSLPVLESRAKPPPTGGAGTELKAMLARLGFTESAGCGCGDKSRAMDRNGTAWCRANRAELVAWLKEKQAKLGWGETLKAAALAVTSGLAAVMDPADVAGSLFDEAVRRADARETTAGEGTSPPPVTP